jgi:hypothetical protein
VKKHILNALAVIALLVTLSSCSKEEKAVLKPVTTSSDSDLPYIDRGDGEQYYPDEDRSSYSWVGKNYLLTTTPLSLEQYENGASGDSICNKEITLRFDAKGRKSHDKVNKWGTKPRVVEEYAPVVTFRIKESLTIKFSRLVTAFGVELNTPYKGRGYGITFQYRNTKLDRRLDFGSTRFLNATGPYEPRFGQPGGAELYAESSPEQFDEVTIVFEPGLTAPSVNGPFDLSLAGFRYKLAR